MTGPICFGARCEEHGCRRSKSRTDGMPAENPLTKEEWLIAFHTEAGRLRDLYMSKLISAAALQEWVKHRDEDPVKVAQAWAKLPRATCRQHP